MKYQQKTEELLRSLVGESGTVWRRMLRESGGGFFLKVCRAGLGVIISIVLARIMGPEGYGAYVYVVSWASILAVPAAMGLPALLTREVARYKARKEWRILNGILGWANRVVLLVSLVITFISVGLIWYLGGGLESPMKETLYVAVPLPLLLAFMNVRKGALKGIGHVVKAQFPELLVLPGTFLAFTLGTYLTLDLDSITATAIRVISAGTAFAVATLLLKKKKPKKGETTESYERGRWYKSALPFLVLNGVNKTNKKIPTIVVGTIAGAGAAGTYGVAVRAAFISTFVRAAINMTLAPKVSTLYSRGDMETLQKIVYKSSILVLIISVVIATCFIGFGDVVLSVFGSSFRQGYTSLCILLIGRVFDAAAGSVGLLLSMTGNESDTVWGIGFAMLLNFFLCAILVPYCDIEGAAISATISSISWNLILGVLMYKREGIFSSPFMKLIIR